MNYLLKKKTYLMPFMIFTVAMMITVASSLSTTEVVLKNSGLISYSQSPSLARPLHVEGNRIKNDVGEIVYLRGWNKGRTYETKEFTWGTWGTYSTTEVDLQLDRMKFYGASVVGVMYNFWSWINDHPTPLKEGGTWGYRQCIDDMLSRAGQRGIYVILTPNGIYPKDCPIHGWGKCPPNDAGGYGFQDVMGLDPYSTTGHEGLVPDSDAFANLIANVVEVLGGHVNLIIGFYAEPWHTYSGSYYANLWQNVWQKTINAVRQKEAEKGYVNHLIIAHLTASLRYTELDDPCSNFNWFWNNPLNDSAGNLVYCQNCFRVCGSVGYQEPKTSRPYTYEKVKAIYEEEGVKKISEKVPVIITSIGVSITVDETEPTGTEYEWLKNSLQIFNEWGLGYLGWAWWDANMGMQQIEVGSEKTTGGTVNKYGQLIVDAIREG
jgi:hypothetical protein